MRCQQNLTAAVQMLADQRDKAELAREGETSLGFVKNPETTAFDGVFNKFKSTLAMRLTAQAPPCF